MRHRVRRGKLNRTHEHRRALLANMSQSLIEHEQIETTLPKAKALRPYFERLITLGKKGTVSGRRIASQRLLGHSDAIVKLFSTFAERYRNRPGGYLRIVRSGFRYGDAAPLAIIEVVDRDVSAKGKTDKERHQAQIKIEQDSKTQSSVVG